MFEVKAKWMGGWKFEGKDGEGHTVRMDWSKEVGGDGDGFRPAELILWGLAGCTGSDTVEILKKMRLEVDDVEVIVRATKAEGYPARFARHRDRVHHQGEGTLARQGREGGPAFRREVLHRRRLAPRPPSR